MSEQNDVFEWNGWINKICSAHNVDVHDVTREGVKKSTKLVTITRWTELWTFERYQERKNCLKLCLNFNLWVSHNCLMENENTANEERSSTTIRHSQLKNYLKTFLSKAQSLQFARLTSFNVVCKENFRNNFNCS